MRATRKRATAIIQTMKNDDAINMIQAAQLNGTPETVVVEWYQQGGNYSTLEVCREFYWAVQMLLRERETRERDRQFLQTVIAQARAGDKQLQRILKRKSIDYLQQ